MKVEHSGGVKAMIDEQLDLALEALRAMLDERAGEAANVIERTAEPVALPARPWCRKTLACKTPERHTSECAKPSQ